MAAPLKRRASRRLAGAPYSTITRCRTRVSLDTLQVDELMMVLSHLAGKDMARLEVVCKALGRKAHQLNPTVSLAEDGLSTVMELAAKRLVEATDTSVRFRPNKRESWKRLPCRIEKFQADRYVDRPFRYGRPRGPQYGRFSKSFVNNFIGHQFSCQPEQYSSMNTGESATEYFRHVKRTMHQINAGNEPTKAPKPELMEYRERAVAAGSAAAQYALACHCEIGAGVPQDRARARELYQVSADQGCTLATQALV